MQMSLYEAERARHERESVERDRRQAARLEAEQAEREAADLAEIRAQLEERVNEASDRAGREASTACWTAASHDLSDRQRELEDRTNDPDCDLSDLYSTYRSMLAASERLAAMNELRAQAHGGIANRIEPPTFAVIAQMAATRYAKAEGREFGFEATHAIGTASLNAASEVRADDE
jgi:Rad3-related DNA helicase